MRSSPYTNRAGITLVEMLVVVSIMVLVMAIAIPVLRPALETRETRDAARSITAYFGAARFRALESRRPYGVMLERHANIRNASVTLRQVEIPPSYAGDADNTRVTVQWTGTVYRNGVYDNSGNIDGDASTNYLTTPGLPVVTVNIHSGSCAPATIRPSDLMRFSSQNFWFRILPAGYPADVSTTEDGNGYVQFDGSHPMRAIVQAPPGTKLPWQITSPPLSFEVERQPYLSSMGSFIASRTAEKPLLLPRNTTVDLSASGSETTPGGFDYRDPTTGNAGVTNGPVVVIFSPDGNVERVLVGGLQYRVTEPLYLMLGKRERMPMPDELPSPVSDGWAPTIDQWPNWLDTTNLWLVIHPQSGAIKVAENTYQDPPTHQAGVFEWDNWTTWWPKLYAARDLARTTDGLGGR